MKIVDTSYSRSINYLRTDQINALVRMYEEYSPLYCDTCHKTGNIITIHLPGSGKAAEIKTQQCICAKFHRVNEKLQVATDVAGIPVKYREADISSWRDPARNEDEQKINDRTISIVKSYAEKIDQMLQNGYGLFLCGPNGVGKTYLACAVGIKAVHSGHCVKYYTMPKIVRTVVDGWYDEKGKVVVNDIEESDFLIIDDLDKAYQTKTKLEIAVLDNLFRERLQNNRPMLVTSNKTLAQVKESYGGSVHSMFNEHCAMCPIVGEDHRRIIADNIIDDILAK